MTATTDTNDTGTWNLGPALAGWLLPGLGHFLIGERQRGMIICATIGVLWLAGMLIGGISVFDRQQYTMWYYGQAWIPESLVVEYTFRTRIKPTIVESVQTQHTANPTTPLAEPSFGRVAEQGVLYTALAGLLNLLTILDLVYRDPEQQRARVEQNVGERAPPDAPKLASLLPLPLIAIGIGGPAVVASTPFLDPMPLDTWWLMLLPPLVLAISLVYKAIKVDNLEELPRQAISLTAQIIAFMVLAAAGLWLLTEMV